MINGYHFDKKSEVLLSSPDISIDKVTFVDPTQIVVDITASNEEGDFDIIIKNKKLDSGKTGEGKIKITAASSWIDLRTIPISSLGIEKTNGLEIQQDANRGLYYTGNQGAYFGRGIKFTAFPWKRSEEKTFSFVVTIAIKTTFMFEIGDPSIDVNNMRNNPLFLGQIQPLSDNGRLRQIYGGGGKTTWVQELNQSINFQNDQFYKFVIDKSGKNGSLFQIFRVNADNFDNHLATVFTNTITNSPSDAEDLIPFWNAVNYSQAFITAFKIG